MHGQTETTLASLKFSATLLDDKTEKQLAYYKYHYTAVSNKLLNAVDCAWTHIVVTTRRVSTAAATWRHGTLLKKYTQCSLSKQATHK